MKKLELVGVVAAVAAVFSAVMNGGTDAVGATAFAPVMILAVLQHTPYEGKWKLVRNLILGAAILGGGVATFMFGLLAGMLHETSSAAVFAGYAVTAGCGFVMYAALLVGGDEITRTGVYRYARADTRA